MRASAVSHHLGREHVLVDREDLTLDLDLDRRVGREEQIRGLLLDHELEQRLGVERRIAARVEGALRAVRELGSLGYRIYGHRRPAVDSTALRTPCGPATLLMARSSPKR